MISTVDECSTYVERNDLRVNSLLASFIEIEVLPGTDIKSDRFWDGFSELIKKYTAKNAALLDRRDELQKNIDAWHVAHRGKPHDREAYKAFLMRIGYLLPEGGDFQIETSNIDAEVSSVPGPQLVVPITNARFVLNAANARWGSLYDALYGTDAMGIPPASGPYDRGRGARVVTRVRVFLDEVCPLVGKSHGDVRRYHISGDQLLADEAPLLQPSKFIAYRGHPRAPDAVLLKNNGLHIELIFDRTHPIGCRDQACLADVRLESAISAIMDCEDSVACVDAADKISAYRNWLGLMKGDLSETFEKSGERMTRRLKPDLVFTGRDGGEVVIKGRALLMVRNVGHLMRSRAILDRRGSDVYEGLIDGMVTTLIALHDLKKANGLRNSQAGSVYVVKPKMHGPEEVAFADNVFTDIERVLGLPRYTVKLGIMDEERRTSINLKECIRAAKHRVFFINTGFLDRTGDEIHTSMEAGPFSRKDFIKRKGWITAYENQSVDIGLECGLSGRAQIGKGMWAMPDRMAAMLETKIEHPRAGANCAWVPSPTAATLHALHYHQTDVLAVQKALAKKGRRAYVDALLDIPIANFRKWTADQVRQEVENNAQGILGYVVRWVDSGIGCSKVPDVNDVALMEDRATCRISAQHIANWLHHGVVGKSEVLDIMRRMAEVVDRQNIGDPAYRPMAPRFDGAAFRAACDLVFQGAKQPSGYTEPLLHSYRRQVKDYGAQGNNDRNTSDRLAATG